jgi:hypothetical protein
MLNHLSQGHRVNHNPQVRVEMLRLAQRLWKGFPAGRNGEPTDAERLDGATPELLARGVPAETPNEAFASSGSHAAVSYERRPTAPSTDNKRDRMVPEAQIVDPVILVRVPRAFVRVTDVMDDAVDWAPQLAKWQHYGPSYSQSEDDDGTLWHYLGFQFHRDRWRQFLGASIAFHPKRNGRHCGIEGTTKAYKAWWDWELSEICDGEGCWIEERC